MIKYRILGRSGLKVTEIGLGCWAIGGPSFSENEIGFITATLQPFKITRRE